MSRGSICGRRLISASSAAAAKAPSSQTRASTRAARSRAPGSAVVGLTNELSHLALDHVPAPLDVVLEGDAHEHDEQHEPGEARDLAHPQRQRLAEHRL